MCIHRQELLFLEAFGYSNASHLIQDNYFEEALKMRNLLEEFRRDHGIRPPTILGVREHVFTGRYIPLMLGI